MRLVTQFYGMWFAFYCMNECIEMAAVSLLYGAIFCQPTTQLMPGMKATQGTLLSILFLLA